MPIRTVAPVIINNGYNYHHHEGEDKTIAAVWITFHVLPILWIIITFIISKIKKPRYYNTFDDEEVAWGCLLILIGIDILLLIASFIYSLL